MICPLAERALELRLGENDYILHKDIAKASSFGHSPFH